ncbi:hypothetical protein RB653_004316 [Dictyostelium firmibasis]|uniref:Ankyrin repeat protein n=1 Tax=Dictyostelium firmibasis TaxID=79012 RepID=A0AAN7U754_9MYCE
MSTIFSNQNSRLLFEKCRNNETDKAIAMIKDRENLRINVNERFEGGCTSFFICCYLGNLKVAKILAEECNVDITLESDNITPFTVSCVQGKVSIVEYLLTEYGNKVDIHSMITGLVGACQYGYPQIVRRILGKGELDINITVDDFGATLLYVAVETENEEVVSLLLNQGSNPNISRGGYYPIHLSSQSGNLKILEILLKSDQSIETTTDVNVQAPDGATSLLIAAQNGNIKVVDLLYKYGADPNIQMKTDGSTPLYVAAARHHKNTVDALLENKKLNINQSLFDGTTALHVLAQFGHLDCIEKVFDRFQSTIIVDPKKNDQSTPLHLAARHGQYKVCQFLIDHGADITLVCDGDTPYSIAKRYGRADTIKVLEDALNNKK